MIERMPPMDPARMSDVQRKAAAELIAGHRKGVVGPFIPLMRSPVLMDRLGRVGEYLRFENALPQKLVELAILVTSRHVTNQFEWALHHPLAVKAGVARSTLDAVAEGRRPEGMPPDEAAVHDFAAEVLRGGAVSDAAYARVRDLFGEQGVVDLTATVGYFVTVCLVMNVAGTPPPQSGVAPLKPMASATRP
ncbi:MAG: carboxymuconolactone decarboxylase family protein [Usitatibacter sp.]